MFDQRSIQGIYFALSAYLFWGVVPVYFKSLSHVSAVEILIQRVLWSVVLLLAILAYTGQFKELLVGRRKLAILCASSLLLATNWLIFISSILDNNIVETSLGYFINPLVSVFLGMMFLGERMRPLQWLAISIAAAGIFYQLFYFGEVPWRGLALAFSFGFYGLIRKQLNLHAIAGLTLETLLIAPIALAGLFWLYNHQGLAFSNIDIKTDLLLITAGFVTSFPLLCFAAAVTRLSLTTTGLLQYIAPSLSLIIAVLVYDEAFGIDKIITFSCIWVALVIFTTESLWQHKKSAYFKLETDESDV